jgi:outer membrane protein TolC
MAAEDGFMWAAENNARNFLLPVRAMQLFRTAICVMSVCVCAHPQTREDVSHAPRPLASWNPNTNWVGSPACQSSIAEGTTTAIPLTLKQAADLTIRQSPRRVVARILVNKPIHNRDTAHAEVLPQANLAAREGVIRHNVRSIIDIPANGLGPRPLRVRPSQSETGGAFFSQQLVNLGLTREYQIGSQDVKSAKFDELSVRENIVAAVVTDYLSVLQAIANEKAVTARVALAQRLYEQALRVEETGVGTAIDTLRPKWKYRTKSSDCCRL